MKIITTLILVLVIPPVSAEIYKCEENGKTSYQQFPCKRAGQEFKPLEDISLTEQKAAVEKLDKELAIHAEQKQLKKEADDKERMIRAQEENADAAYENARASRVQTLQNARQMEDLRYRPYNYPIISTRPIRPIPTPPPLPETLKEAR